MTNNTPYFIALNKIPSIGPRTIAKLLMHWPQLEAMFKLSKSQLENEGLSPKLAASIANVSFDDIETDLRWQSMSNHHLLTWEDPKYPPLLKEIHDPPIVLYAAGQLSCLEQSAIAIVGTRKPSILGGETAWKFASDLALHQITIVSGLALGIDAKANAGALEVNGKTIAVLGTGIDEIYPHQHRCLADKIQKDGLLLSEFPLKTKPMPGHFPRRNRIISGLSLATLVVEAAIKSGSLITARLALEQNRDVLAVPGSIVNPQARGCHYLLQQGAKLVTSIQDIMEELGLFSDQNVQAKPTLSLATDNENLVKYIGFETTTVDQIVIRSGLGIQDVVNFLSALELQGTVKAVPGGYMRCSS